PPDYARFLQALEVPLGDRDARDALDAEDPDSPRARAGFLRGGNHPEDVDGMVWLYRGFSSSPLMRDAVEDWVDGDRLIAELQDEEQRRQQLMDSHQRWTLAAAGAGIGVFEWSASDDRYHFDGRAAALFGLAAGPEGCHVDRVAWRSLLHADDLPAVRAAVSQ